MTVQSNKSNLVLSLTNYLNDTGFVRTTSEGSYPTFDCDRFRVIIKMQEISIIRYSGRPGMSGHVEWHCTFSMGTPVEIYTAVLESTWR